MSGARHGDARGLEGLNAEKMERVLGGKHPLLVPPREQIFAQHSDLGQGQFTVVQCPGRYTTGSWEVDRRLQL